MPMKGAGVKSSWRLCCCGGFAIDFRHPGPDPRNQLASEIKRVVVWIEAANQKRGDAKPVVLEDRARDLLRRADQARGITKRAGGADDRHPQPLVVHVGPRRERHQALPRLIDRLGWRARALDLA